MNINMEQLIFSYYFHILSNIYVIEIFFDNLSPFPIIYEVACTV